MADAPDLGSGALNGRAGSTPASDTNGHVPPTRPQQPLVNPVPKRFLRGRYQGALPILPNFDKSEKETRSAGVFHILQSHTFAFRE